MKLHIATLYVGLLFCGTLQAQESAQEKTQELKQEATPNTSTDATNKESEQASVVIASMKNPALKPYRIMAAGMDTYDEYKSLAPNAPLYFKLSQRKGKEAPAIPWQDIKMRLASDDASTQIPILDNGRFVLERNEKAYEENAELILNQRKSSFSFRPDIRTPGLASNVYRMGDQHLNCKMEVDMAKKEAGFFLSAFITTFLMKINWCETKYQLFSFPLNDWAISMKTINADQHSVQAFRGTHFNPAFWDKSISPNTLYEFELWSTLNLERQQEIIHQQQFVIRSGKKNSNVTPLIKDQQVYQADIAISDTRFQFRIDTDKGVLAFANSKDKGEIKPEQHIDLKLGDTSHHLQLTQTGLYRFTLDLSDIAQPRFQVQRLGDVSAVPKQTEQAN